MLDFSVVLQVVLSTLASMFVGFLWYSELMFVRVWWRHTFPGIRFGDSKAFKEVGNLPLYLTLFTTIIQNSILTFSMNFIYPLMTAHAPGFIFPISLSLVAAGMVACISFPHFVYSRKPFTLYLICRGHDTLQVIVAVCIIYVSHAAASNTAA